MTIPKFTCITLKSNRSHPQEYQFSKKKVVIFYLSLPLPEGGRKRDRARGKERERSKNKHVNYFYFLGAQGNLDHHQSTTSREVANSVFTSLALPCSQ